MLCQKIEVKACIKQTLLKNAYINTDQNLHYKIDQTMVVVLAIRQAVRLSSNLFFLLQQHHFIHFCLHFISSTGIFYIWQVQHELGQLPLVENNNGI